MKVVSVVGARPQFVKAAPVSRQLRLKHHEILVHTGQHYDGNMSGVFFDELEIQPPDYHLGVGSGTHGAQTGAMLERIEQVLIAEQPDWVLVYGDTNSTLAGALAAAKLHRPVAHVEAGLRSYNRRMPEEINRVIVDHLSYLLLCSSDVGVNNLAAEGITQGVYVVGDVMADALQYAVQASSRSDVLDRLGVSRGGYLLATVHRAENSDNAARLCGILEAFIAIDEPIIFPIHPRTRSRLTALGEGVGQRLAASKVRLLDPMGYIELVTLERGARLILTDSGGIQKEAYWLGVPCVTLRDETEWIETVNLGWNQLAGAATESIVAAVNSLSSRPGDREHPVLYGDGASAGRIVHMLEYAGEDRDRRGGRNH